MDPSKMVGTEVMLECETCPIPWASTGWSRKKSTASVHAGKLVVRHTPLRIYEEAYNTIRPQQALDYLTLREYRDKQKEAASSV